MTQRLSRRIWLRHPTRKCRFAFAPGLGERGLLIEANSAHGKKAYQKFTARFGSRTDLRHGALLVDVAGHYVFVAPGLGVPFLSELAAWALKHVGSVPALAGLSFSGAADQEFDPVDDRVLDAMEVDETEVTRAPELWTALSTPTAADAARALDTRLPGQRMWYWVAPGAPTPLILTPLEWDPNMGQMNDFIRAAGGPLERGFSGTCSITDDGSIQFLGADASQEILVCIADWVRAHATEHPGLARLRDCALIAADSDGRVSEIIRSEAAWEGVPPRPVAPVSISDAARRLEALEPGGEAWFWMAGDANGPPFLALSNYAKDRDGRGFSQRLAYLSRRFSMAKRPLFGILRRLQSGRLMFSIDRGDHKGWAGTCQQLVEQHGGTHPAFAALADAGLVYLRGTAVLHAVSAAP